MTSTHNADSDQFLAPRDRYWRSLDELQQSDDFVSGYLNREFPVAASEYPEGVSRRRWMQLMAASLSLAGAAGCRYPTEIIAPFVIRPEGRVPGEQYGRATNFEWAGRVHNLVINNVDGRPIKIEGSPHYPGGGTSTDAYVQASVLSLYDPDRSRGEGGPVLRRPADAPATTVGWEQFDQFAAELVKSAEANQGAGFALLMPPSQSPSLVRMVTQLRSRLPQMTVCRYDGIHGDAMRLASSQALGAACRQSLDLKSAKVVLTVQADLLGDDPGFTSNAKGFAALRDPDHDMSRYYCVEAHYTNTGATADTRLPLRPSQMPALLAELERRLDAIDGVATLSSEPTDVGFDQLDPADRLNVFLEVVAADLKNAGADAVVVVGESLGPEALMAAMRINSKLGSLGKLQRFLPAVDESVGPTVTLPELVAAINGNQLDSLLILGDNPVFNAPGDVPLAEALGRLKNTIYLGEYDDETAALCGWSLPLANPLESWGDCINDEGLYGVCQPQILPLLGGRTVCEVLAVMLGEDERSGDTIVRRTADSIGQGAIADRQWRQLLHDGFDESLKVAFHDASYAGPSEPLTDAAPVASLDVASDSVEVLFLPSDCLYDGRFGNNGWLLETPQTMTKLTWDNAAVLSPRTAKALGVKHGDRLTFKRGEVAVDVGVFEIPGYAPGVVALTLGFGRTRAGMVGGFADRNIDVVGVNVGPLRTAANPRIALSMAVQKGRGKADFATTQDHWAIDPLGQGETESRSHTLIREGTVALLEKNPHFVADKGPHVPQVGPEGSPFREPMAMIRETRPELPQWGMTIDLNKCFGCNACVVACQSENNVPIVGKEQVAIGREMHWLRMDRYFQGDLDNTNVVQQPVSCQHCETAPCEQVCPVAATVHSEEGLNAMVYNRCIGTRYCANNCPYKVRRFNYFNFNTDVGVGYGVDAFPGTLEKANRKLQAMVMNPEVTVRGRGVMEKCTYCVQRIEAAKIEARRDGGRPVRDGEIRTACQSACASDAIAFGNIMDPQSVVAKKQADRRAYGMLTQLNTKPRTMYLAKIRNTHPRLLTSIQLADLQTYGQPAHHDEPHGDGDNAAGQGEGQAARRQPPSTFAHRSGPAVYSIGINS